MNERKIGSKDDERVLVVPTRRFRELGDFQGFSKDALERCDALFDPSCLRFMRRGDAELDFDFKQLIPYVLFIYRDSSRNRTEAFAYLRGKGQGEKRLLSRWSVGVGGHINSDDSLCSGEERTDLFTSGAMREIKEEVVLNAPIRSFRKVGLVNDDSTEVGRVHLGVVCVVELERPEMSSNEPDLLEAKFRDVDELLQEMRERSERFESWSILALRELFEKPRLKSE